MTDEQTTHANEPEAVDESAEPAPENHSAEIDLTRVRDLVLAAHPDVVPEMVQGATFDELMASVEPARDAYQRIASAAASTRSAPKVAAQPGHRSATLADIESLSPLGKISEGLRRG